MNITVEVSEEMIQRTIEQALANAFLGINYDNGQGKAFIREQVVKWARAQDYTALIRELAPSVVREVVASELAAVVKVEAKKQVRLLKDSGELGGLFSDQTN